ncbi:hypothetical protein P153DRAFT_48879 [Dothidotthia symphoricarpi CBS 119687]|uniref:Uncharacterized protein n=1 Tax=Dothidotthia symphoricarpi CBS 119687 TaxID=1392245 RepID=A0A6A6A859_9PLEO|nr:uncharacterized protein P153DRAFT_48879 [Dothidotthia symphoricarpi CBS 119687]KAF2128142.1 hypothetical protein P153DRAFT_48879 [Dothidotthia symphoricarpi CBS 119687]
MAVRMTRSHGVLSWPCFRDLREISHFARSQDPMACQRKRIARALSPATVTNSPCGWVPCHARTSAWTAAISLMESKGGRSKYRLGSTVFRNERSPIMHDWALFSSKHLCPDFTVREVRRWMQADYPTRCERQSLAFTATTRSTIRHPLRRARYIGSV